MKRVSSVENDGCDGCAYEEQCDDDGDELDAPLLLLLIHAGQSIQMI